MKKNNKIFTTREIRKSNFNLKKYFRGSSEMRKYEIFQRKCRLNGNLGLNDFLLFENYDIRGYIRYRVDRLFLYVHACVS